MAIMNFHFKYGAIVSLTTASHVYIGKVVDVNNTSVEICPQGFFDLSENYEEYDDGLDDNNEETLPRYSFDRKYSTTIDRNSIESWHFASIEECREFFKNEKHAELSMYSTDTYNTYDDIGIHTGDGVYFDSY